MSSLPRRVRAPRGEVKERRAPIAASPAIVIVDSATPVGARLDRQLRRDGYDAHLRHQLDRNAGAFIARLRYAVVIIVTTLDSFADVLLVRTSGVRAPLVIVSNVPGTMTAEEQQSLGITAILNRKHSTAALYAALLDVLGSLAAAPPPAGVPETQIVSPELDPIGRTASMNAVSVRLTSIEFVLLKYLVDHAERPIATYELRGIAWGEQVPRKSAGQLVSVYVCRLRAKLASIGIHHAIHTVRRYGYVFLAPNTEKT